MRYLVNQILWDVEIFIECTNQNYFKKSEIQNIVGKMSVYLLHNSVVTIRLCLDWIDM